jgi:preprotein translocase subunit SecG
MQTLQTVLLVLQVIIAVSLIGFILIQHGKGADAGAAFGSGASSTVFGSAGSGNFLTRTTTVLAILFLSNSLFLGYLASKSLQEQKSILESEKPSVMEQMIEQPAPQTETVTVPEETDTEVPVIPEE